MKYIVQSVEQLTARTGTIMYKTKLLGEGGGIEEVNLFEPVTTGQELMGTISLNEKGYKNFKKDFAPRPNNWSQNQKVETAQKIEEIKKVSIREAQDRKEAAIGYFNSLNSAIEFVTKFGAVDIEHAYIMVLQYRDKFLDEWKRFESKDIKDKTIPF